MVNGHLVKIQLTEVFWCSRGVVVQWISLWTVNHKVHVPEANPCLDTATLDPGEVNGYLAGRMLEHCNGSHAKDGVMIMACPEWQFNRDTSAVHKPTIIIIITIYKCLAIMKFLTKVKDKPLLEHA